MRISISLLTALVFTLPLSAQTKRVAVTFDDLPYATFDPSLANVDEARKNIRSILDTLHAHHVPVVAFVNEKKLMVDGQIDMRVALLQQWLDGDAELGNHTYSHVNINKTPEPQCEDEIIEGEVITSRLMKQRGRQERYFRHPFLMTGADLNQKRQFEAFLHSRGYTVAPVTLENLDWAFNTAYCQALKDNDRDTADKVLAAYLAQTETDIAYYEKMSQDLFGRNISHVMLLHSNQVNALELDKVLSLFERHGYKFITLEEALQDPAYRTPDNYTGHFGEPWEHRWAFTLGKKPDFEGAPDTPKWVWDLYTKATAH